MCQGITVAWIENISWKSFLTLTMPVCHSIYWYLFTYPNHVHYKYHFHLVNSLLPSPKWYHCHNCWGWDAPIFCTFLEPPVLLPSSARADPLGQRLGSVHFGAMEIGDGRKVQESQAGKFTIEATHGYIDFRHTCMHTYKYIYIFIYMHT